MLGGKVLGQSYAQMSKSKAANASGQNTQLLSVSTAALTLKYFKACAGGFFLPGLRRICKKIPLRNFSGHPNFGYLLVI